MFGVKWKTNWLLLYYVSFGVYRKCSEIWYGDVYATMNILKSNCRIKMMENILLNELNVVITNNPHLYVYLFINYSSHSKKKSGRLIWTYLKLHRQFSKITYFFCRRPEFCSQLPCDSSQLFVNTVSGGSDTSFWHLWAQLVHASQKSACR